MRKVQENQKYCHLILASSCTVKAMLQREIVDMENIFTIVYMI